MRRAARSREPGPHAEVERPTTEGVWGRSEEAVPTATQEEGSIFRWRRGNARGGCIVIPCGCLASLAFLTPGVAAVWLLVL